MAVLLLLTMLFVPYSHGNTSNTVCFSTQWPQELSELKPDPSVRFGKLPNGFRYVIKHNETPPDRVAIYLNVRVGSIYEKDNERGYAHYLEHMVFNGTTHFPPGKLIEYFQKIGMNYGADTNAYTTFETTVYTIVLPKGDVEEVEKGLLVMSDYVQGALLLPEEVDRERGVILSEKLARDSVEYRTLVATNIKALQGTLLADRQPIGKEKNLQEADSNRLRAFYDRWYRPDNMVLVIVGDVEVSKIEDVLRKRFNDLQPRSPKPLCPDMGGLTQKRVHSFYYYEPQAGKTQVAIGSYWNTEQQNDSFDLQVEHLREYLATSILQKRLEKIAEKEVGLLRDPRVYAGELTDTIRYSGISASTSKSKWHDLMSLLETTLRQAITYGVTNQELELAKKDVLAYLEEQVVTEDSRKSTHLVREILYTINNNRVFQSPQQEQRLFSSAISAFTAEDLKKSLINLFNRSERLIEVTGNAKITDASPEQYILTLYNKSKASPVHEYSTVQPIQFPYLFPEQNPLKPLQVKEYKDIDVHSYIYGNDTVLFYKKSEFEKNQVSVQIRFGPGQRGEPVPGMAMLGETVVDDSGTAKLTNSQLAEVLTGSSITHSFSIDKSQFSLSGKSLTGEVELLFDTLFALLRDPGIREEVYQNTMARVEQVYKAMSSEVRGSEALYVEPFMAGGNTLFGMIPLENVRKIHFSQIQNWILPIFANAQLEISVVGDVEEKAIVDLVGKYFAILPPGKKVIYKNVSVEFPKGVKRTFTIESDLDKTLLAIAWRTQGFKDIVTVRRLNMLADIFEERIRLAVREKLGASYSPVVYHSASRFIPEYGMLYVRIITDVIHVEEVEKVVRSISRDLTTSGVTEEELVNVKRPTLTSLKDMTSTNSYWLNTVLSGATLYPEQLLWPTTIMDDYKAITAPELSVLAEKYLKPTNAATAVVSPDNDKNKN